VTFFYAVGHLDNSFLIQNGTRLLAEMPDVREAYIERPELRANIVEEILRIDAAEQFVTRAILEDIEVEGEILPAGGVAVMVLGSGNVDERAYENPKRFDYTREDLVRKQLAFGAGQHGCQGQMLARAQVEIALTALLDRHPGYRVSGEIVYGHNEFIRAIRQLPIEF
jgi:cytochrome P450